MAPKTIFCSVHPFAHIRQHYFSKYWGTNAWAVPHLKLLGDRPTSPPRSPPLLLCVCCLRFSFNSVAVLELCQSPRSPPLLLCVCCLRFSFNFVAVLELCFQKMGIIKKWNNIRISFIRQIENIL